MPNNKETFQERLARIEQRNAEKPKDEYTIAPKQKARRLSRLGIRENLNLLLGIAALPLAAIAWPFFSSIPEQVEAVILEKRITDLSPKTRETAVKPQIAVDPQEPITWRDTSLSGLVVFEPGLLGAHDPNYGLADLALPEPVDILQSESVHFAAVPALTTCSAPTPAPNDQFVSINIEVSPASSGLYFISKPQIVYDLEHYFMEGIDTSIGTIDLSRFITGTEEAQRIRVIVTDTTAPQFLVLQSAGGAVLWDIITAPEVEISKVIVISHKQSAVFGQDLIDRTHFLTLATGSHMSEGENDGLTCPKEVLRTPSQNWQTSQLAYLDAKKAFERIDNLTPDIRFRRRGNPFQVFDDFYASRVDAARPERLSQYTFNTKTREFRQNYNDWFVKTFGKTSFQDAYTAHQATHVLVGPPKPLTMDPEFAPQNQFIVEAGTKIFTDPNAVVQDYILELERIADQPVNQIIPKVELTP